MNNIDIDKKYVWHPFTNLKQQENQKLIDITKGKSIYVWDKDGNKYIDAIGSWWTQIHGHSHPRLVKAIQKQVEVLDQIHFAGNTHKWGAQLAKMVIDELGSGFTKAFYSDDGSTAVEVAIKMAFQYHINKGEKRKYFVSLSRAYHGDTIGGISLGGIEEYEEIFGDLAFKVLQGDIENFTEIEDIIKEHGKNIAGVIVEPLLQGAAGMRMYNADKLEKLRALCDKYGIILIFDEVFTGFGRTGELFAFQNTKISPDIICLGKGLGGGMLTIAMTCTKDFLYNTFKEGKYPFLHHGHTFTANPIVCNLGIESLKLLKEEKVIEKNKEKSIFFEKMMHKYFGNIKHVFNIRKLGMVGAFDILETKDREFDHDKMYKIYTDIINNGLKNGIMIRPMWNVIYFIPSLHITKDEIEEMFKLTVKTIKDTFEKE